MSDWHSRSNLPQDVQDEILAQLKSKKETLTTQFDRIMQQWYQEEKAEEEDTIRTISNMTDRLEEYLMKNEDMTKFTPSSHYHFVVKNREHLKLFEDSEVKFKERVKIALGNAIFKHHMTKAIQLELPKFDLRIEGKTPETIEEWEERKALPEETKCKQIYTKLCMRTYIENFRNQYDKLTISFEISDNLLTSKTLHELETDDINKLVKFNCMIMGFNGAIKYNEERDEYLQTITVMEPEDETVNNNPRMLPCVFRGYLTEKLAIGQRKKIVGRYYTEDTKEEKIKKLMIDVIHVEDLQEKKVKQLDKRELEKIKEMIKTPVYEDFENKDGKLDRKVVMSGEQNYIKRLLDSFAPHIEDRDLEKKACILALIGGDELNEYRAESHLGLVGDPGCGKSELLKFAVSVAPKGAYVDASNATGKGLLFALDEHEGGKILRAGAMVMNSGGMVGLDEFDKMKKEEQKQVNVAMEQQFAKYDKGGHNVIASTKTTVIMACNPKNDKWNINESIVDNLNFGASTVSRYDVFIRVKNQTGDMANRRRVKHILKHSQHKEELRLDIEYIKGLLAYCKSQPVCMTEEAEKAIEEFYVYFKGVEQDDRANLPIEDRQLIGIIRLCCAYARLTFQPKVTEEVVREVIQFYKACLNTLGISTEKGVCAMDLSDNALNKDKFFEDTFNKLAAKDELGNVVEHELYEALQENSKHFKSEASVDGYIQGRDKSGYLYEPTKGLFRRI